MQNIVKIVSEKTGLSEAQSQLAVNAIVSYIKEKLPPGMGNQVESFINGGGLNSVLGNTPGGNIQNPAANPTNQGQNTAGNVQIQNESLKDKAEDVIDNLKEKLGGMLGK